MPPGVEPMLLDETLPKLKRDSGPSVIASSHIDPSVIVQVAARVSER